MATVEIIAESAATRAAIGQRVPVTPQCQRNGRSFKEACEAFVSFYRRNRFQVAAALPSLQSLPKRFFSPNTVGDGGNGIEG